MVKLLDKLVNKKIEERLISKLTPHPENEKIYGKNEDVSKLVEDITNNRTITPLIITPNNVIIAGHRRYKACQILGIESVSVMIMSYDSYDDEVKALIADNAQRQKTTPQIRKEYETLERIKIKEADERKKKGGNQYTALGSMEPKANEESGRSAEIIADIIGASQSTIKRIRTTTNKAKQLTDSGQSEKAEILIGQLDNISIRAGEDATKIIDQVEVLDDGKVKSYNPDHKDGTVNVEDLKDGTVDLREILPKKEKKDNRQKENNNISNYNLIPAKQQRLVDFILAGINGLNGTIKMIGDDFKSKLKEIGEEDERELLRNSLRGYIGELETLYKQI